MADYIENFLYTYNLLMEKEVIEIKTNLELSKYIKELAEDVKLDVFSLREKSLMNSSIWAKWLSYLFHEKENLTRIQDTKQKILKKKMSENKIQDSVLRMKSEDKISDNDENIKKLNALLKITLDNIDYIERALNILLNFGFNIKNSIELLKLLNG